MIAKKVKVYGTPTCPYCHMVTEFLKENKVSFEYIDVSKDQEKAMEMVQLSGQIKKVSRKRWAYKMAGKKRKKGFNSLWLLLAIFLSALGFALIIQGIIFQSGYGFKHGFFAYLLAFVILFFAKTCKAKAFHIK